MALVTRIEVLNQHERHAGIVRQMAEQLGECLQPAGGGSYANTMGSGPASPGSSAAGRTTVPGRRLPVFFANRHHLPFSPGKTWHVSCHWRPATGLNSSAVRTRPPAGWPTQGDHHLQGDVSRLGTGEQILDGFADLHELIETRKAW
jgi:hypothetical protein